MRASFRSSFLLIGALLAPVAIAQDDDASLEPRPAADAAPRLVSAEFQYNALVLEFDQPMLTWQTPSASPALRLTPDPHCLWYWQDDTRLACTPPAPAAGTATTKPFGIARPYRLDIAGLAAQNGTRLAATQREIVAEPPTAQVRAIRWDVGVPVLVVASSQAIDEASLRSHLQATFGDTPLGVTLEPLDPKSLPGFYGQVVGWRLRLDALPKTPGRLQVKLLPGLRSQAGPAPGQAAMLWNDDINVPFALTDVLCDDYRGYTTWREGRALACAAETDVLLVFSRELDAKALAAWAAELPDGLALADDPTECRWRCDGTQATRQGALRLRPQGAGRTFRIDAGPPLRSTAGEAPGRAAVVDLQVLDFAGDVRREPPTRVLLPGSEADVPPIEARNLPTLQWAQATLAGGASKVTTLRLPATTPRNEYVPLPVPGLDARIAARGGLQIDGIAVTPAIEGMYPGNEAYATAVAAFNLIAIPEPGRVLVWASDWASAEGLRGVDIDLVELDRDGRETVLASARTGADGSAWLESVPPPEPSADGSDESDAWRVVRARHRGHSTVLPLAGSEADDDLGLDDVDQSPDWPDRAETVRWGATSRLLYRPGDTVEWRLWLRERRGPTLRRLAATASTLELHAVDEYGDERVHETWSATLDAWGSASGRTRLPETLEDGIYCISESDDRGRDWSERISGACFQVARFDAPSLWATLDTADVVRLRGDVATLAGGGGFFSGGPAANAGAQLRGIARPASFTTAWPALARWEFLDATATYGVNADPLDGQEPPAKLDGEGGFEFPLVLPARLTGTDEDGEDRPLAFARLQFNLAVDDGGKAKAVSPATALYYAAHESYVGLRTSEWWLSMAADPRVEAVVSTFAGELQPGTEVQLRFETQGEAPKVLARCTLRAGVEQACPFRAPEAGMYVLVAESGDAAPVRLHRWFGDAPPPAQALAETPEVALELVTAAVVGGPATLRLHQPHAAASALVLVEHDGVLAHWQQDVGTDSAIVVPVQPDWPAAVSVRVLLRPRVDRAEAGLVAPTRAVAIELELPPAANPQIGLTLAEDQLAPGAEAVVVLHNPHASARSVTLAIVDDAVHQQASALHPTLDPAGPHVLGKLGRWRVGAWHALENWKWVGNPLFQRIVADDHFAPPPLPGEPMPVTAPPAPPPPPASYAASDDSTAIDTVEVTGSRLKRADLETASPVRDLAIDPDSAPVDPLTRLPPGMTGPAAERVRSAFPETAYWNPGLELAPGETREVRVRLPDNLTRWRVLAWSSDDGADLELHEATLQTALAVELRTGLPAMLYPGDAGAGIVSARRNEGGGPHLELRATATGAGVDAATNGEGDVAAHDLLARPLALAPTQEGRIDVLAHASDGDHSDALSASVLVRSQQARLAIAQTGWLDRGEIVLGAPALPAGASDASLSVIVAPGLQSWRREWIAGLREYPHRCWEQILSRGIGAAFALQEVQSAADWPDAQQLIDDAWRVAAQYRDPNGRYVYFTGSSEGRGGGYTPNLSLSAYTLRAYAALEALGQPAPAHLREPLQVLLLAQLQQADIAAFADEPWTLDTLAASAGALADARALAPDDATGERLTGLWRHWDDLSWYGRSELVRALAAMPALHDTAQQGVQRLRDAGVRRGASRRLDDPRDFTMLMGSSLRDQCALVTTLAALDDSPEGRVARGEFLRGLQDLYAGGNESLDSQANAQCLLALRAAGVDLGGAQAAVQAALRVDGEATALTPAKSDAEAGGAQWSGPLPSGDVVLSATPSPDLSYVAEVGYRVDLRDVPASGTGMQLQRSYAVMRAGRWMPVAADGVRIGDWIRVTLQLTVPRQRHFVAITDIVPGGWASRDVTLAGVAGEDVRRIADNGSWWFATRQTGAGEVKLYAERLPAGVHEVHWYAQATHAGSYFAAPAIAELMYGRASRATTAGTTIVVATGE